MAEQTTNEESSSAASPGSGDGPCDVWPPAAGCCGGGKAWLWNAAQRRWLCVPRAGCP